MDFDVRVVRGDLKKAAAELHKAGRKELQSQIRKSVTESTKPFRRKVKQAALDALPAKGGLNRWAAVTPTAKTEFRGSEVSMRIQMRKGKHDLESLDKGKARHPVFGNRGAWVTQSVRAGWFTKTVESESNEIRSQVQSDLTKYVEGIDLG